MTTTHTLPAGTMAAVAAPVAPAAPVAVTALVAPAIKFENVRTATLTELLNDPERIVRKDALSSFIYTLNFQLLAKCQSEVLWGNHKTSDEPTWDEFDKFRARQEVNANNDEFADISGGARRMPSLEIATHLGIIRAYALRRLFETDTAGTPPSLVTSMEFKLSRMAAEAEYISPETRQRAALAGLTAEHLHQAVRRDKLNEHARLTAASPKIIGLAHELSDAVVDEEDAERAWDSLPTLIRLDIYTLAVNAMATSFDRAVTRYARGKTSAWVEMQFARNMWQRGKNTREQFITRHERELENESELGYQPRDMKQVPDLPTMPA